MRRSEERREFLADLVIGVAEDFGTNPWRYIVEYDCDAPRAVIEEVEYDQRRYEITPDTMAAGLGRLRRGEIGMNSRMLAAILAGDRDNDAGDIDAYDADMIMQAAIFGELVYG